MPNLSYTIAAYVPFQKILSANINQDKTDIKNRINWSGSALDITTGLDGTNIQSTTAIAEVKAALTTQNVTVTATTGQGTNGNNITLAFTSGATAGSEVVTVVGTAISVQIATGVSTATQVVAALNNSTAATAYIVASGVSASTVSTAGALSLSGGISAGGLTRSTKMSLDYANWVVVNNSSGQMSSVPQLGITQGGTGLNVVIANQSAGDVVQINATKTAFTLGPPTAVPSSLKFINSTIFHKGIKWHLILLQFLLEHHIQHISQPG
jgi:hypothetical protein